MNNPIFVMSFWKVGKYISERLLHITSLSLTLLKRHGYKVHFIGNDESIKDFKNLKWDYIHNKLNSVNKEYKCTWSISKIEAFKHCCELYDHFYHIDGDVFIYDPITEEGLKKEIMVQEPEGKERYKMFLIKQYCGYKPNIFDKIPNKFYNMGFFGGKSLKLQPIIDECLKFIYHPRNKEFFTSYNHFDGLSQAILAEQGYFASYVYANNIEVSCIKQYTKNYYHHGFHKIPTNKINYANLENIKSFLSKLYN